MKEIVLSEAEISDIFKNLGQKITDEIKDEEKLPILVGIMKGGLNFTMDLLKNITAPVLTDYIQISSYSGTSTTGIINMKKDMTLDCKDRTVILVEDVVDSGYSIHYLKNYLFEKHQPKRLIVVCLLNKVNCRKIDVQIDYDGKKLEENKFLMGYGLDYNELYRNIPYVFVPSDEEVKEYDRLLKERN